MITAARELGLTPHYRGGSNFTMNLTLMRDSYAGLEYTLPINPSSATSSSWAASAASRTLLVSHGGPTGRQ